MVESTNQFWVDKPCGVMLFPDFEVAIMKVRPQKRYENVVALFIRRET